MKTFKCYYEKGTKIMIIEAKTKALASLRFYEIMGYSCDCVKSSLLNDF